MKGVVFTELREMAEQKFGMDAVERVMKNANLPEGRVYVAGGTYPFEELLGIVVAMHKETKIEIPVLLREYGRYLFHRLIASYPQLAAGKNSPLDFIEGVDHYIHVEVRKLYPDAELPKFSVESREENKLTMIYQSGKKMESFGEGLMLGCAEHFKTPVKITFATVTEDPVHTVRYVIETGAHIKPEVPAAPPVEAPKGLWAAIKSLFGVK